MKTVRWAVATAVAAGLLAACGSGGTAGESGSDGSSPEVSASPKPSVKAPENFDTSKGWHASLDWLPKENSEVASHPPVGAAPKAGIVAFLQRKGQGYVVEARDAATGELRWSSREWQPPAPTDSGKADATPQPAPQLLVVDEDGREYVALWAYGKNETAPGNASGDASGEGASDEKPGAFSLVFYPADSSGKEVAPAPAVTVPADADSGRVVHDGGNGVVVRWTPPWSAGRDSATIDISDNRVQTYEDDQVELPPICENKGWDSCRGKVAGLSPDGPLVERSIGSFGVGDTWLSRDAIPPGTRKHKPEDDGRVWQILGDHVVSSWSPTTGAAGWGATPVMAVHDLKSGKLEMSTVCDTGAGPQNVPSQSALSPNGRYAVAGTLALDFEQDKAHCLVEQDDQSGGMSDDDRGVHLVSVGDDGIAYGYRNGDAASGNVPVAVPLDTGKIQVLPEATEIPFLSLPEVGGFALPVDGPGRRFVFHPRR
ncbi:hypothetical protein JL475_37355 [Streptomyces sp. M2CJ-2]|uniref:hypothetical protein n=1 Tax=Streptomyces sp. M2CJ-2 TaxID=2803948 RepID=UPI0019267713|nr:hypothetical protein [Streptomyces sp. M2CJ-2]MBL3671461.1 hypothetical protein [Streptomyces sp. M2CJ-2]